MGFTWRLIFEGLPRNSNGADDEMELRMAEPQTAA